ncbi:hypothetical protein HALLA_01565 (plasmid) [Halostagnicola larsenii XH-48]|uniref:Uncharacterized protein n=1 Tax=Halostagnicola larsenii XH-48 TaxID=797299 RepID=W0JXR8_9EURY|nr:hypothetical protein HALLA_01565 [Halostagnicola larsenii XH-48]
MHRLLDGIRYIDDRLRRYHDATMVDTVASR